MCKNIIVTTVNICPEDGIVDRSCFSEAQAFVYDIIQTRCVHDNYHMSLQQKLKLPYMQTVPLCRVCHGSFVLCVTL